MVLCSLARVRTAFPLMIAAAEGACGQALILRVGLHQAAHLKVAWRSVVWGQLPASPYQLAFEQQMLAHARVRREAVQFEPSASAAGPAAC